MPHLKSFLVRTLKYLMQQHMWPAIKSQQKRKTKSLLSNLDGGLISNKSTSLGIWLKVRLLTKVSSLRWVCCITSRKDPGRIYNIFVSWLQAQSRQHLRSPESQQGPAQNCAVKGKSFFLAHDDNSLERSLIPTVTSPISLLRKNICTIFSNHISLFSP